MSRKGILTYNVFHFLKERKKILQENLLPTHECTPQEVLEYIEMFFWGFVPSQGTRQDDTFLILEEKVASPTPGMVYNPICEKWILLGSKKTNIGNTAPKEERKKNVKFKTKSI